MRTFMTLHNSIMIKLPRTSLSGLSAIERGDWIANKNVASGLCWSELLLGGRRHCHCITKTETLTEILALADDKMYIMQTNLVRLSTHVRHETCILWQAKVPQLFR